jgi:hypothetical protein
MKSRCLLTGMFLSFVSAAVLAQDVGKLPPLVEAQILLDFAGMLSPGGVLLAERANHAGEPIPPTITRATYSLMREHLKALKVSRTAAGM